MKKGKRIIGKFFFNELSKKEKKKFLMNASENKSFLRSFVKEIELHNTINKKYSLKPEQDLYTRYYQPFIFEVTRYEKDYDPDMIYLINLYLQKDYSAIYHFSEEQVSKFSKTNLSLMLLGVSCLEMQDFARSQYILEKLEPASSYYSYSCWYLALIDIKKGNYAEARKYLAVVEKENLQHMQDARDILHMLDQSAE